MRASGSPRAMPRCPGRGAPDQAAAAPFDFPWLQPPGAACQTAAEPAPPARTFSQADLDAALAAARAEAAAAAEPACAPSSKPPWPRGRPPPWSASRPAGQLQAAFEQALAARAAASRDLAAGAGARPGAAALERQPLADIEAMLRDLLVRLEGRAAR